MNIIAFDSPRLLADIGGTYARFALETAPGEFAHAAQLRCADHEDFHAAVRAYLDTVPTGRIQHAGVAIANPVEGDEVRMTNYHWQFSIEAMRQKLGFDTLVVVNDFTAAAMALPRLSSSDKRQIGGGQARERSVIGILGSGSGLGVSGLIPADDGWIALGTEGGHTSFAPRDERELAILHHAWKTLPHVSFERLLSGPGLELIYRALAEHAGVRAAAGLSAPEITRRALAGSDAVCVDTLDAFCAMLGTAAGNLAVTLGALGGIYIGGGIVPRLGDWFGRSRFRERFEDKGRFSAYLAQIPTWVVTAEHATFVGVSAILAAQLRNLSGAAASAILGQIQRARPNLSPAERRVADHVLAHPRSVLNDPVAEIARAAQVSQPTVIRFCRSLGCEGLSDFKLRLASGLTGTVPVTHTQVTRDDSVLELGSKVLGNTASAVLQVRDHLNRESIDRAIALLRQARRVDCFAVGYYGSVAQDAQYKFLRLGLASGVYIDPRVQAMAAQVLGPGDVAFVISGSGRKEELLHVADAARERGAAVIAITGSQTPLARKADVALIVDHVEDVDLHLPMVSRVLHLLMVDIVTVGLAMERAEPLAPVPGGELDEPPTAPRARSVAPGVSAAAPLAKITSHSH
ncbi:MAG TPA: glucokinase [Burkholderiaceae bacterium]|nr:glucokinase [Burkholderiaceae bacterium]